MKFKVFVSGNQTELREEMFAAQDAILDSPVIRDLKGLVDENQIYSTGKRKNRRYKALLNSD